jgi:hypothetical protein
MPLGFLLPAFLAGLAALAVPIVLHLRQREREKPQPFPSLMFLARIPIRTAQRRRITDWPLLLLRLLALTLLVLAFARPLLRGRAATGAAPGKSVVVLLDRSMSMGHRESWKSAQDSTRAVISRLAPGDRVAVVTFDEAAAVVQPFTIDHAAAAAAVAEVTPGSQGTRYAVAWRAARQLLGADSITQAELVLVSDLQRAGEAGPARVALPAGVVLRTIAVGPSTPANTAVSAIAFEKRPGEGRGTVVVAAALRSYSLPAPRKVRVTLTLGGRVSGSRDVTLPIDGTTRVEFDAVPLPVGDLTVAVAAEPDDLAADDVRFAVLPADAVHRVVLVLPKGATPDETEFLERALEIGTEPRLAVERRLGGTVDLATLRSAAVLLFYDVAPPTGPAGSAIGAWVAQGGGVVVAAGPRLAARGLSHPLSPGRIRGAADRAAEGGGTLGEVALEHPIFAPFRGVGTTALGAARFFQYVKVETEPGAQLLAHFDDGLPAVLERRVELGRVLLVAVPLDDRAGNFPRQGAYLPFVRQLARYAAGGAAAPPWHTTGEAWRPGVAIGELVVASPSGELQRPDTAHGSTVILTEAGIYSAYRERASGEPAAIVAANAPTAESDLARLDPSALLLGVSEASTTATAKATPAPAELEQRQKLWRLAFVVAAALLALETWMTGRGRRAVSGPALAMSEREGG